MPNAARELFSAHRSECTAASLFNQHQGFPAFRPSPGPVTHAKQLLATQQTLLHRPMASAVVTLSGSASDPVSLPCST